MFSIDELAKILLEPVIQFPTFFKFWKWIISCFIRFDIFSFEMRDNCIARLNYTGQNSSIVGYVKAVYNIDISIIESTGITIYDFYVVVPVDTQNATIIDIVTHVKRYKLADKVFAVTKGNPDVVPVFDYEYFEIGL